MVLSGAAASSQWLLWALLSAAFAAATAVLAKLGVQNIDADLATLLRTMVVIVALGALVLATGKWRNPASLDGRALLFLAASGLATGASWLCYFRALKVGDAAKVAPVDKLSVVLVALFAVMFLSERLSVRGWIGISLVTLGVVLLALPV
ncbi:MAG TPA: EamA family transporter [Steroidobacteraceae bacterium]|nr:EamA family transporter [Steroidobacteraceae bacterium]